MLASSCGVNFLKLMQKAHYHLWQNNTNTNINSTNCECVVFCSKVIIVRDKRLFGEEFLGRFVCGAKSNSHKSRRSSVWAAATAGALPFGCNSTQLNVTHTTYATHLSKRNFSLTTQLISLGGSLQGHWGESIVPNISEHIVFICVTFCVTWFALVFFLSWSVFLSVLPEQGPSL